MNFKQFEYVLAVSRHRHFGKAAEECDVTQATLSEMIKRLEDELGYPLFDRSSYPIKTTEEGIVFAEKAREMLKLRRQLMITKPLEGGPLRGSLKIGIIPTVSSRLIPMVMRTFMEAHPKLKVSVEEIPTEEILRRLSTDRLDLGIVSTPLPKGSMEIEEEILYYEAMLVYGLAASDKEYINRNELKKSEVWLLEDKHCFRNQSMNVCGIGKKQKGFNHFDFKGNSFESLINLSDEFGGYTLIPELFVETLSKDRKSRVRKINKPTPVREVSLISAKPLIKKKAMKSLADHIRKIINPRLLSSKLPNKELDIIEM